MLATLPGSEPPVDPNPPVAPNPPVNPPGTLNPQPKALAEGYLAGTAFLNQGADFLVDQGLDTALQQTRCDSGAHCRLGFVAIGGGKLRNKTGSHVDVEGYNLIAGLAANKTADAGQLSAGVFIEHGEGDYDSHNSFANAASVHGQGDTKYTGGGVLAKWAFTETPAGQLYLEASARAGKVKTDFHSNLYDGFGRAAAYDTQSGYVGSHLGVGYVFKLDERNKLAIYGHYLWSRQNSDNVKLTTGETVKFKAVDSQRTKLGARWSATLSQQTRAYAGVAWEHEYDGEAKASIHGYKLDAPKLKGDTGMLELGVSLNPKTTKQGWKLDLGVQAYTGKREGVLGSLKARYDF